MTEEEIVSMYQAGATIHSIAKASQHRFATVRRILTSAGVEIRKQGWVNHITPEEAGSWKEAYDQGQSLEQIAQWSGRSQPAIGRMLRRFGVKIWNPGQPLKFRSDPALAERIKARFSAGESVHTLCSSFGCGRSAIQRLLIDAGLLKIKKSGETFFYKKIRMRSQNEIRLAQELDRRGILWKYEPRLVATHGEKFRPDFVVEMGGQTFALDVKGKSAGMINEARDRALRVTESLGMRLVVVPCDIIDLVVAGMMAITKE